MTENLSIIERVTFLKQVSFFQYMTLDQLKALASICEEEFLQQGFCIFQEGEPGGTLYIVIEGHVAIEREGERKGSVVRLATMQAHSSFGEMNLFDNSPRSATATAVEDTRVLKLRNEPLIALMRQNPDMLVELIKVLNQRIREADDQITRLSRSRPRQLDRLYDKLQDSDPGTR
ncbi:MAG: cyclic nucleotide-binding domain-containing protein [Anaerolineales bacterium]